MTTTTRRSSKREITITKTRRIDGRFGEEVRVYFRFGGRKSFVDMDLSHFSESALKGAIVEKMTLLFSQERAESLVGKSYDFGEVLRDGKRFNESRHKEWFEL
ncbi:MAG TPA: hypothetical protein VEH01_04570 [Nitrososphaerales archaeon]|nr:hypothetical protein [Nitrososphaerales archaeon]